MYLQMKSNIITFLLLFACFSLYGQNSRVLSENLTFEEALSLTLQNNHLIRQSHNKTLQLEQEMKAARALHFPKISLSANYVFMSDNIELDLTPVRDAITPLYSALGHYGRFGNVPNPDPATNGLMPYLPDDVSTSVVRGKLLEGLNTINSSSWIQTIQEKKFGMLNAGFVFPLYTGGKINAANKAARIKFEESEIESVQKASELSGELVERYFGLILANRAVRVREEVKAAMQKHYDDAEKLAGQGMIAKVEVLNAKVYLADADRELKKSVHQLEITGQALLNTLATEEIRDINPVSELFYHDKIEPVAFFMNNAKEKSPLLGQINKKRELARQGIKAERSAYFPIVAAGGTLDIANQNLSPYVPESMIGIGLQWSVFEGNARSRKLKSAKLLELQAEDFYAKASSDITTAINKSYEELNMYLEQINELDTAMEFTIEYSAAREKAFSEGMATATQVSDADIALAKTKIDRLQAIYSWDLALSKLLYYSGMSDRFTEYLISSDALPGRY
jgi:outer membrane protein TolC